MVYVRFESAEEFLRKLKAFETHILKRAVKRGKKLLPEYLKEVERRASERSNKPTSDS